MVTLVCGLPNAGKTTYSRRFEVVVHRDECPHPQHATFPRIVAETVGDVCAEGVYNSRRTRGAFLAALSGRRDRKRCVWLDVPLDECLRREAAGRRRGEHLVMREFEMFEPPTLDEGWDEIIIVRGDDEQRIRRATED